MPLFEIINPADPLTMHAPDLLTAGAAVCLLGGGMLPATNVDSPEETTPIIRGWPAFFSGLGVHDTNAWLAENKPAVADALRSVALGSVHERADYDAALAAITDDDARAEYIKARNDRRRSSLNDIEGRAHQLAERLISPPKEKQ